MVIKEGMKKLRNEEIGIKDTKTTTVGYLTRPRVRSALAVLISLAPLYFYKRS